jgi:hypothetical protein
MDRAPALSVTLRDLEIKLVVSGGEMRLPESTAAEAEMVVLRPHNHNHGSCLRLYNHERCLVTSEGSLLRHSNVHAFTVGIDRLTSNSHPATAAGRRSVRSSSLRMRMRTR